MKNLTQFLFMLLCICLPATAFADANKDKDDDSKYLAGAVPEVDGKVVFTKEFSIPGMSQEEIFKRKNMQAWTWNGLKAAPVEPVSDTPISVRIIRIIYSAGHGDLVDGGKKRVHQ